MGRYVARKGAKEFGGETSRKGKAYHVAFDTMPLTRTVP